ncbi:hypothetical protein, partial [Bartonella sp. TT110JLCBS]|uniref:hypothetical protein n=1 Tax=Bartonella sp. TT110JLCBS TaxID=3243578 RepID=UPI0035CF2531
QYQSGDEDNPQRSLKQALLRAIHDMEDNYGLQTELVIDQDILIENVELHDIMRVVGEALMNVVKHANTNQAMIETMIDDHMLTVKITDHGSLFKPGAILSNHYG